VEVAGRRARVFVGDSAAPVLVVPDLKRGPGTGAIGVLEGTAGSGVPGLYFSNFRYTSAADVAATPAARATADVAPPAAPGAIRRWELSPAAAADRAPVESLPAAARGPRADWVVTEAEPNGLLNIARYRAKVAPRSVVFARTVLRAERDEVRRLVFGYSDDVTVFLNGRPLFAARNGFRARYPSSAGLVTPDDALFLPLRRGDNELVFAVAEEFGGWGLLTRLGDPTDTAPAGRPPAPPAQSRTEGGAPGGMPLGGAAAVSATRPGADAAGGPPHRSGAPDLGAFDRDIARYFALLRTPGIAVGVARGDSLLYFRGLGFADVERRTSITPHTVFWIASVTKTFTAVALKQLEAAGRISLDDELGRHALRGEHRGERGALVRDARLPVGVQDVVVRRELVVEGRLHRPPLASSGRGTRSRSLVFLARIPAGGSTRKFQTLPGAAVRRDCW